MLKNARKYLRLPQEFVARQMGHQRQRKVTTDELDRFSKLYGLSVDELIEEQPATEMFAGAFSELSDVDKKKS